MNNTSIKISRILNLELLTPIFNVSDKVLQMGITYPITVEKTRNA